MAILYQDDRRNLGRNQTRAYGPFPMPAGGYTRLKLTVDLVEAQRTDPTRQITGRMFASFDAGATWTPWGALTTQGSPTRDNTQSPFIEVTAPAEGTPCRFELSSGPDSPVAVGIIIEGF